MTLCEQEAELSGIPDAACDFPDCGKPPSYLIIFEMNCRCTPCRWLICSFHEQRYRILWYRIPFDRTAAGWLCDRCGARCVAARVIPL